MCKRENERVKAQDVLANLSPVLLHRSVDKPRKNQQIVTTSGFSQIAYFLSNLRPQKTGAAARPVCPALHP